MNWIEVLKRISNLFSPFRGGNPTGNIPSPRMEEITVERYSGEVKISCPGITTSTVQNTNSMEPLIDIGHTTLLSSNLYYTENVSVGDIIIYNVGSGDIIHSVISEGTDKDGWFCKCKGLNCNYTDPYKIRKGNIKKVCLGVIFTTGYSNYISTLGD